MKNVTIGTAVSIKRAIERFNEYNLENPIQLTAKISYALYKNLNLLNKAEEYFTEENKKIDIPNLIEFIATYDKNEESFQKCSNSKFFNPNIYNQIGNLEKEIQKSQGTLVAGCKGGDCD